MIYGDKLWIKKINFGITLYRRGYSSLIQNIIKSRIKKTSTKNDYHLIWGTLEGILWGVHWSILEGILWGILWYI